MNWEYKQLQEAQDEIVGQARKYELKCREYKRVNRMLRKDIEAIREQSAAEL